MPLDSFQLHVLETLSKRRSAHSPVAGGAALQRHGYRLSDDIDVFNSPDIDVVGAAHADVEALRAANFEVEQSKVYEGFIEAIVSQESAGTTKIQWVQYSGYNFFEPVPDHEFGWRLHYADLATNKILAAASRREPRDLADLYLVHKFVLPLWHGIWAAVGKDAALTPKRIVERIRYHSQYTLEEIRNSIFAPENLDLGAMIAEVRRALDEAQEAFVSLPQETVGMVLLDENDRVVANLDGAGSPSEAIEAKVTGAWPSGPELDGWIIRHMVEEYGLNGEHIWSNADDGLPTP